MHKRIKILQSCFRDPGLIGSGMRFCLVLVAGLDATASLALAQVQPAVARPPSVAAAAPPGTNGLNGSAANGEAAVSGPGNELQRAIQPPPAPQPPIPIPPLPPPGATPADAIPRVIPLEPIGGGNDRADDGPAAQGNPSRTRRGRNGSQSASAHQRDQDEGRKSPRRCPI